MLTGYARVSTHDQETVTQVAALKAAWCERIFREKASGGRWDRPELQRLLDQLRKSDVLVVWKLDRLSRSLRDVLYIMERLGEAEPSLRPGERVPRALFSASGMAAEVRNSVSMSPSSRSCRHFAGSESSKMGSRATPGKSRLLSIPIDHGPAQFNAFYRQCSGPPISLTCRRLSAEHYR